MNAIRIAIPLIKLSEGLCLRAYPDPKSPLSKALSARRLLKKYKAGIVEIPADLRGLSAAPWTIGYGETSGVCEGMVWTKDQAELRLVRRVGGFAVGVLKRCPQLHLEPDNRLAACLSLAYNIGTGAFAGSSVCSKTARRDYQGAAAAFLLWNKANGAVMPGLTIRRKLERDLYLQ
jgi:lysozyme